MASRISLPFGSNPDCKNWWISTVEDMFRSYQLDGLQWGAEPHGPLMNVRLSGTPPFYFCERSS
jgi:hypothetical protein